MDTDFGWVNSWWLKVSGRLSGQEASNLPIHSSTHANACLCPSSSTSRTTCNTTHSWSLHSFTVFTQQHVLGLRGRVDPQSELKKEKGIPNHLVYELLHPCLQTPDLELDCDQFVWTHNRVLGVPPALLKHPPRRLLRLEVPQVLQRGNANTHLILQ